MVSNEDDKSDDAVKVHRMLIVPQDELESTKAKFKNATVYPYSIRTSDCDVKSVLNFEQFLIDGDDFGSIQKFGHIHNEQITTRPDRRRPIAKPKPRGVEPIKPIYELYKQEVLKMGTIKSEGIESKIDALKEVSDNVSSPRKRASQKDESFDDEIDGDVIKRKRKRVVVEDSDEDSKDGAKDGEFMVTKIKEEVKEEPVKQMKTPPAKKTEPKAKAKGQPSIMSFFRKAK